MLFEALTLQLGYNATLVTLGAMLLGIAAGVTGTFLFLRKRALVSDAISHATLPGVGIAFMLMHLMSRYAADNGHMPEADTKAWLDEQVELAKQGPFFFSLTYYRMSAVKM